MKIISKHKDYYDGCNYSHDASTGVYERKQHSVSMEWMGLHASNGYRYSGDNSMDRYIISSGIIGFCGKIYPFFKYTKNAVVDYAYTLEEYNVFKADIDLIQKSNSRFFYGHSDLFTSWRGGRDRAQIWFDKDFGELHRIDNHKSHKSMINPVDLFLEYTVPYFLLEKYDDQPKGISHSKFKLTLNPCLQDYKFYRMFDSYTAWQEIEMFLNNQIIRPDDPYIEPVSDVLKAEAHGFNKFSFRKDKTKHK